MAYNRPLQHKDYLKLKYLTGSVEEEEERSKKKKLIKAATKHKKIRIIDDDIQLKHLDGNGSDDEIYYGTKEEKPMIAAVIDERPAYLKRRDLDTNCWRTVGFCPGEEPDEKETTGEKDESNQKRRESAEDLSPPRKVKKQRNDSDDDLSPPRRTATTAKYDVDGDMSPPRRSKQKSEEEKIPTRKSRRDDDLSPPRKHKHNRRDDDLSPPRRVKKENSQDLSPKRISLKIKETTLSGKRAGLSDAKELKKEIKLFKIKEEQAFASLSDQMSGRNAKTIFRDSKTGKVRNLEEEARKKKIEDEEKEKREAEKLEKYKIWSKGIKQHQEQQERVDSDLYEMTKPLARYEDDADLDKLLRQKERDDDPMLETIRKKKSKEKTKKDEDAGIKTKPVYSGPTPPPLNRFKIMPGYRWDGVDRSNGFERKYFERIANREANIEEAYKWSTEDM